jgi:hypothetical protein
MISADRSSFQALVTENITKVCPSPILCEAKTTFQQPAGTAVWMGPDDFHVSAKIGSSLDIFPENMY